MTATLPSNSSYNFGLCAEQIATIGDETKKTELMGRLIKKAQKADNNIAAGKTDKLARDIQAALTTPEQIAFAITKSVKSADAAISKTEEKIHSHHVQENPDLQQIKTHSNSALHEQIEAVYKQFNRSLPTHEEGPNTFFGRVKAVVKTALYEKKDIVQTLIGLPQTFEESPIGEYNPDEPEVVLVHGLLMTPGTFEEDREFFREHIGTPHAPALGMLKPLKEQVDILFDYLKQFVDKKHEKLFLYAHSKGNPATMLALAKLDVYIKEKQANDPAYKDYNFQVYYGGLAPVYQGSKVATVVGGLSHLEAIKEISYKNDEVMQAYKVMPKIAHMFAAACIIYSDLDEATQPSKTCLPHPDFIKALGDRLMIENLNIGGHAHILNEELLYLAIYNIFKTI